MAEKLELGKYYNRLPQDYLKRVLNFEGGLCNDCCDRGGLTNRGITSSTLLNAKQKGLVPYSVTIESLTKDLESVRIIYEDMYYLRQHCDKIPHCLSFCVFDCSVNNGRGAGGKLLQRLINQYLTNDVKVDGGIGEKTIKGLNDVLAKGIDIKTLCKGYNDLREKYYKDIVIARPNQKKFLNGWLRRLNSVRQYCDKL